jgi:RimJ/RimL family protein N-acetyltransferase
VDPRALLIGQVIYLRGLEDADVTPDYVAALNDPEVTRYMAAGRVPQTRESVLEFVRSLRAPSSVGFAACTVAEDLHVANAVLRIDWPHRKGDVGILTWRKAHWGRGYGQEAVSLVTRYAFETLRLRRLTFWTHNPLAAKLVEGLGWTQEGVLRKDAILGGEECDALLFGLLEEEWQKARSSG